MRPEQYQPRLTWVSHAWRLVAMLLISAMVWLPRISYQWEHARWWFFADLGLGLLSYVLIWWRRTHPVALATITNLMSVISASSAGPGALAMVSLSTRRHWREIIPQVVLGLVCGVPGLMYFSTPDEEQSILINAFVIAAVLAALVAWGLFIGSRRELLANWRERALSSEAEQQAKVNEARSVERARIAREMHDVLAHRISVVSMTAGALAYRTDLSGDEVRATAKTIQETSHLALTELREVLGVLREGPGDAAPEDPQRQSADAADLSGLVAESTAAGARVRFRCDADLSAVAPGVARTLYRCLQEALTNARKHAPNAVVTVAVKGSAERGIDLLVENPLPLGESTTATPASGFGLVGLAERVALSGGRQSVTLTDDRRFLLHVWLPWSS
ncbi:histidine kinase [Gordonia sp. ABSL1-1]|uniref:sensor histidine kinase n=1 Tax=Gordonia sp. ABSL1-1 TaxID=3053923 RepID=UPI0025735473|nr:histidine kinase [Gordonia sp. ABSL1-1]MDL9938810.1 histidine kinase [Gordonia sp. ABSL1-1]